MAHNLYIDDLCECGTVEWMGYEHCLVAIVSIWCYDIFELINQTIAINLQNETSSFTLLLLLLKAIIVIIHYIVWISFEMIAESFNQTNIGIYQIITA